MFEFLDACISKADCADVAGKPHCRQFTKGAMKTCQSSTPCTETCTPQQFCSKDGVCQGGESEAGRDIVTIGGPDTGATCIFPFTYMAVEYEECAMDLIVGRSWCSTKTDRQGKHTLGNWGECPSKRDVCGSNSDCILKGGNKTVCREDETLHRKCVKPSQCSSACSRHQVCMSNLRCRTPMLCNSDSDCSFGIGTNQRNSTAVERCKQHVPGGVKVCQRKKVCPSPCTDDQFCSVTNVCLTPGGQTYFKFPFME